MDLEQNTLVFDSFKDAVDSFTEQYGTEFLNQNPRVFWDCEIDGKPSYLCASMLIYDESIMVACYKECEKMSYPSMNWSIDFANLVKAMCDCFKLNFSVADYHKVSNEFSPYCSELTKNYKTDFTQLKDQTGFPVAVEDLNLAYATQLSDLVIQAFEKLTGRNLVLMGELK